MRIRYSDKDPRRGQEVELEDTLAQRKIDAGEATEVKSPKRAGAERNANHETERITGLPDAQRRPAESGRRVERDTDAEAQPARAARSKAAQAAPRQAAGRKQAARKTPARGNR